MLAVLFLVAGFSNQAQAQTGDSTTNSIVNQQIWIDFYPHYYMSKKLEYYGDAGYRTIVSKRSWSRLYIRPSLKYHLTDTWEFHAGLGLFYIFNTYDIDQFEITPWQGIQLNWPQWKRFGFKNLLRFEERMSFLTNNWVMDFEFRMRYKVTGKYDFHKRWYAAVYGEYFLPVTGEIQEIYTNKGRAGIELGYKPAKEWQLSFVFNWQGSRTGAEEKLNASDYIYQLKIKKVWHRLLHKKHSNN
ncbi:MAG: DUF2490 domain-containing protein [Bacteroidales bacterium]|nr:DUF2490 domain-containing protein [Bacteroidales bacterium]